MARFAEMSGKELFLQVVRLSMGRINGNRSLQPEGSGKQGRSSDKLLSRFEKILKEERKMAFEKEIKPMTLKEYEQRIDRAIEDVKNTKVKIARNLKKDMATWR